MKAGLLSGSEGESEDSIDKELEHRVTQGPETVHTISLSAQASRATTFEFAKASHDHLTHCSLAFQVVMFRGWWLASSGSRAVKLAIFGVECNWRVTPKIAATSQRVSAASRFFVQQSASDLATATASMRRKRAAL